MPNASYTDTLSHTRKCSEPQKNGALACEKMLNKDLQSLANLCCLYQVNKFDHLPPTQSSALPLCISTQTVPTD